MCLHSYLGLTENCLYVEVTVFSFKSRFLIRRLAFLSHLDKVSLIHFLQDFYNYIQKEVINNIMCTERVTSLKIQTVTFHYYIS